MIELVHWADSFPVLQRPWLIVGKGPSFAQVKNFDLESYFIVSLNHVVREMKVHIAHFADLDAFEDCSPVVLQNADWVMMPYRPHVQFRPGPNSLSELIALNPVLAELDRSDRLIWYNLSTGEPFGKSPVIQTGLFGSEVVVNILALLGVKTIRTLGIDGGQHYSAAFFDLQNKTRLNNGAASYDVQFASISKTVRRNGIDFAPLTEPIRIFIGTDESQKIAARVLEYSVRKRATRPVEFFYLDQIDVPLPQDPKNQPRTGFSFKRFAIPSLCNYRGRAIYLDSDMLVFGDIAELWDTAMDSKAILCTWQGEPPGAWRDHPHFQTGRQMSVMLMDCSGLRWNAAEIVRALDEGRYSYGELMFDFCIVRPDDIAATLPPEWNSLEHFEPGKTKLLHYTVVPTQPWLSNNNPLESLWISEFAEAIAAGAIAPQEVRHAIERGFIKPSLAACLTLAPSRPAAGESLDSVPSARSTAWELKMRAAWGEALIEKARVPTLEREIQSLKYRLRSMENSWTWRLGSIITHPVVTGKKVMARLLKSVSSWTGSFPFGFDRSPSLKQLYQEMHKKQLFPGTTWKNSFALFKEVIPDLEKKVVLDFGCGPKGGLREELGSQVIPFDPYVPRYSFPPWDKRFDILFSSDVLEHLPEPEIFQFAANVLKAQPEYIFLNVSTRSAHKTFSTGENVHLTVRPTAWWRDTFQQRWRGSYSCRVLRDENDECTLLFEGVKTANSESVTNGGK